MQKVKAYSITFIVALVGALLFQLLHLPIPWLLGPIVATLLVQLATPLQLTWHARFRDGGLIVVGLSLGSFFTHDVLQSVPQYIGPIIVLNIVLLVCSVVLAYITAKWCNIPFATAIVCSVPGGLSQLVIFAEEKKSINLSVVTYFHVIRVLLVVSTVPLLMSAMTVSTPLTMPSAPFLSIALVLFLAGGVVAMKLAKWLRIPVPAMLGPVLFVIVLNMFDLHHAALRIEWLHIAQIFVGCHIGLSMKREDLRLSRRTLTMGIVSAVSLLALTMLTGYVFSHLHDVTYATAFLSLAPGGLDQMSLIALSLGGDVALVTLFQLFRILSIYIIVLPLLNISIK